MLFYDETASRARNTHAERIIHSENHRFHRLLKDYASDSTRQEKLNETPEKIYIRRKRIHVIRNLCWESVSKQVS